MRRWSMLFVFFSLAILIQGSPVQAQLQCSDPDLLAIVFDNGDINLTPTVFNQFNMRFILLNPTAPAVDAFEFKVTITGPASSLIRLSELLPPNSINIGDSANPYNAEYYVGVAAPMPATNNQVVLMTWNVMTLNSGVFDIFVSATSIPSIPGHIAYDGVEFGNNFLRAMTPISQSFTAPLARLNPQTPLQYCTNQFNPDFSVTIAGEGETILAAADAQATDGYDAGLDLTDPTPLLTFPHPEWTGSPAVNYERDVRLVYDPLVESKTWTFTAAAASAGSPDYHVDLAFTPSFTAASGIAVSLYDRATGSTVDLLNAGMVYGFTSSTPRTLDLTIGYTAPLLSGLVVDIEATAGLYHDALTRAATAVDATDDFDGGLDLPEPTPPPGNYVTASFEHSAWPLGPRFSTDVRAVFDPTTAYKTWPLMVESDQSGPVVLTFAPNFAQSDDVGLQLRDLSTGQIFNLFPALSYSYQNYGTASVRRFELILGAALPPTLNPANRSLLAGWSMVSLPLVPQPGANTVGAVMLDPSPGYAYAFTYNRFNGYQSVPAATVAAPGIGYWLGTSVAFNWSMSGERSLDGVTVPLSNGWNLVGNANWFPGPFEGLQVIHNGTTFAWLDAVAAGLVSADVQTYHAVLGRYLDAVDLQPWQAYWINALTDNLSLRFDWRSFQQLPARLIAPPATTKISAESWRSDLVLTDAQENARAITFGVEPLATAGFDPLYDRPMPPASPVAGPALSFQHPEWQLAAGAGFTRDLVGPGEEPVRWTVALTAPTSGDATLSWDASGWPEGVDYQLYFPHENRVAVMSMRRQTSLAVKVGPQPLTVVVRTPDMTSDVGDRPDGGDYRLSVQPNPFNPITTVSFDLPRPGRAEVRIYSLRGELLRVLGGQEYTAGHHKEEWNGRDRQGHEVPSGSYFGRLHVDGQVQGQVIRMSLVR